MTTRRRPSFDYRLYRGPEGDAPQVHYCRTPAESDRCAELLQNESVLGLDAEHVCTPGVNSSALLQLASQSTIGLFHLACRESTDATSLLTPTLRLLLESSSILKVGQSITVDVLHLGREFQVKTAPIVELSELDAILTELREHSTDGGPRLGDFVQNLDYQQVGLAKLTQNHLGLTLRKGNLFGSHSWRTVLSEESKQYAANDAYASCQLYHAMESERIQAFSKFQNGKQGSPQPQPRSPVRSPVLRGSKPSRDKNMKLIGPAADRPETPGRMYSAMSETHLKHDRHTISSPVDTSRRRDQSPHPPMRLLSIKVPWSESSIDSCLAGRSPDVSSLASSRPNIAFHGVTEVSQQGNTANDMELRAPLHRKSTRVFQDGSRRTLFVKGGYVITSQEGFSRGHYASGVEYHLHPDGRKVLFGIDGSCDLKWPTGASICYQATGGIDYKNPAEGYRKLFLPDGRVILGYANGDSIFEKPGGITRFRSQNGIELFTYRRHIHGVRLVTPGNTIIRDNKNGWWVNLPNVGSAWHLRDGSSGYTFPDRSKLITTFFPPRLIIRKASGEDDVSLRLSKQPYQTGDKSKEALHRTLFRHYVQDKGDRTNAYQGSVNHGHTT
ncbi:MAG: hypothetical protein M1828_000131 [Chrysothrix sp. TS-e1954]|nr:MAG: hypothetical protein M1828_000131 [Chrysothrix sp. TS-e1954]